MNLSSTPPVIFATPRSQDLGVLLCAPDLALAHRERPMRAAPADHWRRGSCSSPVDKAVPQMMITPHTSIHGVMASARNQTP